MKAHYIRNFDKVTGITTRVARFEGSGLLHAVHFRRLVSLLPITFDDSKQQHAGSMAYFHPSYHPIFNNCLDYSHVV
jgi:hypothetical protein